MYKKLAEGEATVSSKILADLRQGVFRATDGRLLPLASIQTRILQSYARRNRIWAVNGRNKDNPEAAEIVQILRVELARRGERIDSTRHHQLREEGGPCECCQKPALYVVGQHGYCAVHKDRAMALRAKVNTFYAKAHRDKLLLDASQRRGDGKRVYGKPKSAYIY